MAALGRGAVSFERGAHVEVNIFPYRRIRHLLQTAVQRSICFSTAVQDILLETRVRCPPRQKSRVERLEAKVEPLLTQVKVENKHVVQS